MRGGHPLGRRQSVAAATTVIGHFVLRSMSRCDLLTTLLQHPSFTRWLFRCSLLKPVFQMSPWSRSSVIRNPAVAHIRDAMGPSKCKQHTISLPPLLLTPTNRIDIAMSSSSPIPGTGICCTNNGSGSQRLVFYQLFSGTVGLSTYTDSSGWSSSELQVTPAYASPLACVSWNTGGQASGSISFSSS